VIKKLMIVGGEFRDAPEKIKVVYPYDGRVVGEVPKGTEEHAREAVEKAKEGLKKLAALTAYERYRFLSEAARLLEQRAEEFARTLVLEVGKTIREARTEVQRAVQTLLFAAEEAKRINGETFPLDAHPNGKGKVGFYVRVPAGVVAAITPFNFPLNLSMHKVAPALAAGCPVVLKPSERTPLTPLMLGELLLEAGAPPEAVSVIPGYADVGRAITTHPDVRVVSFTGSRKVGEIIARQAGIKKLVLELGSNSAIILHEDGSVEKAVEKTVQGGFAIAGQVCISVQRVFVHEKLFDEFVAKLKERVARLKVGDPMDESTDVGPLIAPSELERVLEWIKEAERMGAKVELGGEPVKDAPLLTPTVVSLVPKEAKLFKEEAFAPVVAVNPYRELDEAIEAVNASEYGLQVGVFTRDVKVAWRCIKEIEAGGVLINEGPTFRADHMPYGGVKYSGVGREGPKFAIEDYTEIKTVVFDLS